MSILTSLCLTEAAHVCSFIENDNICQVYWYLTMISVFLVCMSCVLVFSLHLFDLTHTIHVIHTIGLIFAWGYVIYTSYTVTINAAVTFAGNLNTYSLSYELNPSSLRQDINCNIHMAFLHKHDVIHILCSNFIINEDTIV